MARTNDLDDCCRFLSVLLLAYTFETTKQSYFHSVAGRGEVGATIDKRWRWAEPIDGTKACNWEDYCFGESKGGGDTWFL